MKDLQSNGAFLYSGLVVSGFGLVLWLMNFKKGSKEKEGRGKRMDCSRIVTFPISVALSLFMTESLLSRSWAPQARTTSAI